MWQLSLRQRNATVHWWQNACVKSSMWCWAHTAACKQEFQSCLFITLTKLTKVVFMDLVSLDIVFPDDNRCTHFLFCTWIKHSAQLVHVCNTYIVTRPRIKFSYFTALSFSDTLIVLFYFFLLYFYQIVQKHCIVCLFDYSGEYLKLYRILARRKSEEVILGSQSIICVKIWVQVNWWVSYFVCIAKITNLVSNANNKVCDVTGVVLQSRKKSWRLIWGYFAVRTLWFWN